MHDVAVLDNVLFTFNSQLAGFLNCGFRAKRNVVGILNNLCTDESLFEVGVDYACSLWSLRPLMVGPSAALGFAGGEVGFQVK